AARMRDADNIHIPADDDAFALETAHNNVNAFRIIVGERGPLFEDRHRTSQPAKRLRQFKSSGSGADNDEMLRTLLEIEDAFIRQVRSAGEARNLRDSRRRPRCDHETPSANFDIAGYDCFAVLKSRMGPDDANAERSKTFG